MRNRLVVIQNDPVGVAGHEVGISAKTLEGLEHYARGWPGDVVVAARVLPGLSDPLLTWRGRSDLPFDLDLRDVLSRTPARDGAAVTLALHQHDHACLLERDPRRLVWTAENPVRERIRLASADAGPVARARITLGWIRRRPVLRRMVAAAGGLQANGYPAFEAYASLARSSLLFFDTRVSRAMVRPAELPMPAPGPREAQRPLRVAFSGRHEAAKGPLHAIRAVVRARAAGASVTMDVFGQGTQTEQMRAAAAPAGESVVFHGSVPFVDQWVPTVRDGVDLMVLPHVQGDPAGTYLEAAALGVPVLGFANAALAALVGEHGIGWTVPMKDDRRLAERLVELAQDRGEVALAGQRGIEFMRRHAFEDEFDRRVTHLREVAQL